MRKLIVAVMVVVCLAIAGGGLVMPTNVNATIIYGPYGNTCEIDGWTSGLINMQLEACALGFNSNSY